jgi:hypothetical protein
VKTIIILISISFIFPVVGGWEVDPACPECKYPFNVSLQTYPTMYHILSELQNNLPTFWDGHFCQGSLISNKWVLTTGDCVDVVDSPEEIWVELGLHDIYNTFDIADSIAVENIYFHPNYDFESPCYDPSPEGCLYNYALLELSDSTDYSPISLISNLEYEEVGDSVIVMGWGGNQIMDFDYLTGTSYFMQTVPYENNSSIGECLPGWSGYESILCLTPWNLDNYDDWTMQNLLDPGFPGGACNGDEGASLITINNDGEYELLGNFYLGCVLDATNQNKFTRVSTVTDWIYSYIGYPCEDGAFINVSIAFDDNSDETSWELWYRGENPNGGYLYLVNNGDSSEQNICISDEGVYEFIIYDEGGDGLSEYPWGSYTVTLDTGEWGTPNEQIVANGGFFDSSETTLFAWPDLDGDLIIDSQDIDPDNQFLCGDQDLDSCDDCSSGIFDLENNCDLLGDINQDLNVDVLDVVLLVSYILGEPNNELEYMTADINGDSNLDVLDVVLLIEIILNPQLSD